ncbi:MAG: hypothetical protein HYZ53_02535 [Planctomycetes bacterium]|nr:hypothetical protein [Planctomycetota bacterium]
MSFSHPRRAAPPTPVENAALALHAASLEGQVLAGRYRIRACVAVGGQGIVFRAEHLEDGTPYAVKLARLPYDRPARFGIGEIILARERIRAEAEALRAVAGGRFPRLYDVVEGRNPLHVAERGEEVVETEPYVVTEWVEGHALGEWPNLPSPPDPRAVVEELLGEIERMARLPGRWVLTDLRPSHILRAVRGDDKRAGLRLLDAGGLIPTTMGPVLHAPVSRDYLPASAWASLERDERVTPDESWTIHALGVCMARWEAAERGARGGREAPSAEWLQRIRGMAAVLQSASIRTVDDARRGMEA